MSELVFIHGNPASFKVFKTIGKENSTYLSLPGLPYSNASFDPSIFNTAELLFNQIKHLNTYSIVAHDWGVIFALLIACKKPEAVESFIFFNSCVGEIDKLPKWLKLFKSTPLKHISRKAPVFPLLAALFGTSAQRNLILSPYLEGFSCEATQRYIELIPDSANKTEFLRLIRLVKDLKIFDKPTLIVWGVKDPVFKIPHLSDLILKFPNSQYNLFDGNHYIFLEKPTECKELISIFLKHSSGESNFFNKVLEIWRPFKQEPAVIELKGKRICSTSFKELFSTILDLEFRIKQNFPRGSLVLILAPPGASLVATFWATIKAGCVPVLIDPSIEFNLLISGLRRLPNFQIFSPTLKALPIVTFKLFLANLQKVHIACLKFGAPSSESLLSKDTLFVAFTSGGTGIPKPVVFTSIMVDQQACIFKKYLDLKELQVNFSSVPAFFIYNTLLAQTTLVNYAGALSLFDWKQLLKHFELVKPSTIFGSVFFWKNLLDTSVLEDFKMSYLKKGIISGSPIFNSTAKHFLNLASTKLVGAYGATEALPISFFELQPNQERGVSVGQPISEVEVFVDQNKKVWVAGDHVSPAYLCDELNKEAKLTLNGKLYHFTGDVGELSEGTLTILGRYSDCSIENNFFPYSIELAINQDVDSPAFVVYHSNRVWVFAEKELTEAQENFLRKTVTDYRFKQVKKLPYDRRHNSKILRDKLRQLCEP